ncbi:MAG: hypothetical protein V4477_16660 [Pseudomonadota bacterium]
MTNYPVIKLGRIPIRKYPFANLADVQRDAKLQTERDLRHAPTPISGGMRKALSKELGQQKSLHNRSSALAEYQKAELEKCYGLLVGHCKHCRHTMWFDEDDGAIPNCDRCKRPMW